MANEPWPRNECVMDLGRIKLIHPAMLMDEEVEVLHRMVEIAADRTIQDDVAETGLFQELVE